MRYEGKGGREDGGKGVAGDFAGAGSAGLEAAGSVSRRLSWRFRLRCWGLFQHFLGLLAVLACFALSWQNGLGMLVVAWLVSPLGIPLVAAWALDGLEKLEGWVVERVYH